MAFGIPTLALGTWNSMLHPRAPAGSPMGGKFAKGSGGSSKAGGKGGGKGAGAKGAAAQKAAEANQVLANLKGLNPQQRAEFLSKLSDPQLKALLHAASQGNSNDPVTRSMLTAIKDQMAARSLTGAKGPTAINAAKKAAADKSAASKAASTAKKAASAQASAAKKATAAQTAAAKKQTAAAKAAAKPATKASTAKPVTATPSAPSGGDQQAKSLATKMKAETDPVKKAALRTQLRSLLGLAHPAATSGDGPDVTFNAAQRRAYAKKKIAMADGSFPIPDKAHLRKAIMAVGRAHPSKRAAVKAHIRRRAAALGVTPPAGAKKGT